MWLGGKIADDVYNIIRAKVLDAFGNTEGTEVNQLPEAIASLAALIQKRGVT
ncbi:hypothetical protein ACQZ4Y_19800 [Rhizobium sp. L80/93]|uniref:hypothetical protein n=1 Tax=Rhizobium sp. E27B/91 TaxID=2819995 RepID=UPI001ADB4FCC|nr:hypothetical protein [Rhizobium sp. E27B/91]MBO9188091.1 hypothetical protein [Rhizobium sp. E27B/91]